MTDIRIRQALVSVSDKAGLVELARSLSLFGVSILSTGGTAKLLGASGIKVTEVAEYTGLPGDARRARQDPAPEDPRRHARTARPARAHGGDRRGGHRADRPRRRQSLPVPRDDRAARLYARRRDREHRHRRPDDGASGGEEPRRAWRSSPIRPTTTRSSPRWKRTPARSPPRRASRSRRRRSRTPPRTTGRSRTISPASMRIARRRPSRERFDLAVGAGRSRCATARTRTSSRRSTATAAPVAGGLARYVQLQGKELSYNNIADADAAWECVKTFDRAACVDRQAREPLRRRGSRRRCSTAYRKAFETDPTSAFGGIIAFNRPLDGATADARSRSSSSRS